MINHILLILYVASILLLSYKVRKGTLSGFILSNRDMHHPAIIGIAYTAAYFSAASFLGGGGYGLVAGMPWTVWAVILHVSFACLAWLLAPRIWSCAKEYGARTVPEMLARRYDSQLGKLILAFIMLIMYTVYLITIFKGSAHLFEGLLGTTYLQGLIITMVIVAIYFSIGGLPAILWVSFIQGLIMIGGAILLYGSMFANGNFGEIWSSIPDSVLGMGGHLVGWEYTLGTAFAISLGLLALPDLLIMMFSAKDRRVVKFGGIFAPISIAIYAITIFSMGILAYGVFSMDVLGIYVSKPDTLIPFLAKSILPQGLDSIVLLAVMSAAFSTISAIVLVTTTSLTTDIVRIVRPGIGDGTIFRLTRMTGIAIIIISAVLALNPPALIVPLVSVSLGVIACCVFVPMIFGLFWDGGNSQGFIASLMASFGSTMAWHFYGNSIIHPVFIGLLFGTLAFVIVSVFTTSANETRSKMGCVKPVVQPEDD